MKHVIGFTLIESLVVIAMIGVIAAIAMPNLTRALDNARIKGAAQQIVAALYFAKTESIRQNKPVHVQFGNSCIGVKSGNAICDCTIEDSSNSSYCSARRLDLSILGIKKGSLSPSVSSIIISPNRGIISTSSATDTLPATVDATSSNGTTISISINMLGKFSMCTNAAQPLPGVMAC
ncbi:pilus assembly FimT family protein [Chitiniphilus eburneus]|uniref:Type II secretion system protein H n=1 Tax=Chitiniphilus eburneus TaxID=2571148 RepID=A0A4V5MPS6_9NEIS|nr:GspH/FimT family pseudopilin [Chitiniphilus eburneus]TJZ69018.1 prepilin-type N-terminal cleavage/methylation domain-containing protein [Chitiniphilus eburneus]